MNKDDLQLLVSMAIDWEYICDHLEYYFDVEINPDSYTFIDIEKKVSEMILAALKNEPDFTYKY